MESDNMAYLPNLPAYDANVTYGTSDYWQQQQQQQQQTFAEQNDPQPTHPAPFFQAQQDLFLTGDNHQKTTSMFTFTGAPTQTYRACPNTMQSSYPASDNPAATESSRAPASKRQRMSQLLYDSSAVVDKDGDRASLSGTPSDCCSSCSGGINCEEPDCSPCHEVSCGGAAVAVCSVVSCPKPACGDGCLSTALQVQSSLTTVTDVAEGMLSNLDPPPWNAQAQQHMGQYRTSSLKIDPVIVDPSPATTPSMARHSETPGSPYQGLPTPQSSLLDQQVSYSSPATEELSGTGAMFNVSSEQWGGSPFGSVQERLPCGWRGCTFVAMSHGQWVDHFHSAHFDTQIQFGCPISADNCTPIVDTNPFDHLQKDHGYELDFSSGALSCPATTCPPDQTYGSPRIFHDHFHHHHATPLHASLHCEFESCGTFFDDPNQFVLHMTDHVQESYPKNGEIDLLAPSASAPTASAPTASAPTALPEPASKPEPSDAPDIPHLCLWKSKNGDRCNFEGTSASTLQEHVKDQHLSALGKSTGYICQWDGCRRDSNLGEKSGFSQRGKLERHMATHTGFKCSECPTCGQLFSAPQALRQHILLHTGEKPWKCRYCDKRFPQQSACTIHERTHTNEKPLECNICGKKFSESSNLAKHRKIHGEKGLHACSVPGCGKSFHRLDQLKRHALTHEKPPKDASKKRVVKKGKSCVIKRGLDVDDVRVKVGSENE